MNGISVLIKRDPRGMISPYTRGGYSKKVVIGSQSS